MSTPVLLDPSWYALAYEVKTGKVADELPLLGIPQWANIVNNPQCGWSAETPIGGSPEALAAVDLANYFQDGQGRWGCAICYGTRQPSDWIAQAGPCWAATPSDDTAISGVPSLTVSGTGFWGLMSARLAVPASWTPALGVGVTAAYGPSTRRDIVRNMLADTLTRGTLPLDVPAAIGDSGTAVRNFPASELAYLGTRLQELTQDQGGPDVVFVPYFSAPGVIRHQALIGNPYLSQGAPVTFDYGTGLVSVLAPSNSSGLATDTFAKGGGTDPASLVWGYANDTALTTAGWPLLEYVDSNHTSVILQADINAWAASVQAQQGRPVKAWVGRARLDAPGAAAGSYAPGQSLTYALINHPWLGNGSYVKRLLGYTNSNTDTEMIHILDAG